MGNAGSELPILKLENIKKCTHFLNLHATVKVLWDHEIKVPKNRKSIFTFQ